MAENGRQALAMLRAQPFDLVLLDLLMPEMDGYQGLEHLQADDTLRHIYEIGTRVCEESRATCTRLYSTGSAGRRGLIDAGAPETVLSTMF